GHRVSLTTLSSKLNAQYDASEFAPPTFAQDSTPDFRNHEKLRSSSLQYRGDWNAAWSTSLRLSDERGNLDAVGAKLTDRFRTEPRELEAQLTWRPAAGQSLTVAAERLEEKAKSSSYLADVQRDTDSLVLAYAATFGAWSLQAEARHDDNTVY